MPQIEPVPDAPLNEEPDTVATPEGDNEFAPNQPLREIPDGRQVPRGNAPQAYDEDKPAEWIEVIDEVSRGKIQP